MTFDAERDSFHAGAGRPRIELHDELRAAQLKVAAEIERARRIQTDLLPTSVPHVEGIELEQRIEFLGDMGGDYYDYIPFGDGRLGIVCGDVMGKGLAAALIMAMARSLLHDAIAPGKQPGDVMAEVNDGLTRDLEGQRLPYFLTLALAAYDPSDRSLVIAGGGHNPVLVAGENGVSEVPSRGAALGVRTGLQFPEDRVDPGAGRHGRALHRRPHRGARPERHSVRPRAPRALARRAVGAARFVTHLKVCGTTSPRSAATAPRPTTPRSCWCASPEAAERQPRLTGSCDDGRSRRAHAPASLQVYRYTAGADRVEAVIGTLEPELPQEDLVAHASEALERETFMCYAVSQPDDFVADELCFVPQGDTLRHPQHPHQRLAAPPRRPPAQPGRDPQQPRRRGGLRQAAHPRHRTQLASDVGARPAGGGLRDRRTRPSCSRRGRPWTTCSSRPASTTSTASAPSCASRRR